MAKKRERTPTILPEWVRKRIEVNVYHLFDVMEQAGSTYGPETLVLDAGAGQGRFKPEFEHTRYIGIDLAVGDVNWDYSALDAISNLVRLPLDDDLVDVVLCTQVLEHVPEPQRVLNELSRVLKPGGKLYLSAPQSWHQHQKPHDYYRYTSFGLRYLLTSAGLEVDEMLPMGGYFWFLSFQLQNINYWIFPRGMKGRRWTWPLRALFALLFQVFGPLILFYLDPLDRTQDETFGYVCTARKPAHQE